MNDLDQAKVLLQAAMRDLRALQGMKNADIFADEIFGFHVQQATEKCLKAQIAAIGEVYPFTHNLDVLLRSLEDYGYDMGSFWELSNYNSFAVQLRYETLFEETEMIEREAAIATVQSLYAAVENVIIQGL